MTSTRLPADDPLYGMVMDITRRSVKRSGEQVTRDGYAYDLLVADLKRLRSVAHRFPLDTEQGIFSFNGTSLQRHPPAIKAKAELTPSPRVAREQPSVKRLAPPAPEPAQPPARATRVVRRGSDLLMWVGFDHYPTIESFVREARVRGPSKRLSKIPENLMVGTTRLLLAHDEGVFHQNENGQKVNDAVIFAWFTIERLEVLVPPDDGADYSDPPDHISTAIAEGQLTPIPLEEARLEPYRECGFRTSPWAIYASASPESFHTLERPIDYLATIDPLGSRFRSYMRVDATSILQSTLTTTDPRSRAVSTLSPGFTGSTLAEMPWSKEERAELMRLCEKFGMHRGCKEFTRQTVRSFQACIYQYRQMIKALRGEEESGE